MADDRFFVGWAPLDGRGRRGFLLGAAGALAGAGALGALLAQGRGDGGDGAWVQGEVRDWTGWLARAPYPMLRMRGADGALRTALLAGYGKLGVDRRIARLPDGPLRVRASLIARGDQQMLAIVDGAGALAPAELEDAALRDPPIRDLGEVALVGEILDSKCWLGAMKPGFGKTHKACAALCAHGRLPLLFCAGDACRSGGLAPLLLDEAGHPHDAALAEVVADPVTIRGRLVQVGDLRQLRAARAAIVRL